MGIDKDGFLVSPVLGPEYVEWANGLLSQIKLLEEKVSVIFKLAFGPDVPKKPEREEWVVTDGENALGFLRFWPAAECGDRIVFKSMEAAGRVASEIVDTVLADSLEGTIRVMRVEEFEKLPKNQPIKG